MKAVDPALVYVPFGGKVIVFGGDFRQMLLVVPKAEREDIVNVCLQCSYLWQHVQRMSLKINMRFLQNANAINAFEQQEFATWLLELGEGKFPMVEIDTDIIRLPEDIVL